MKIYFIILLYLFISNCQSGLNSNFKEIKVKSNNIITNSTLSEIVDDVQYVVLDSTAPFQSRPDKILFENDYYYLINKSKTSNVVKYNKSGKYLLKIEPNIGPVLFNDIKDALIDSTKLKLLVDTRVLTYDKNTFNYIGSKELSYPAMGFENGISNDGYIIYLGFQTLKKRKLILYSDKECNEIRREIDAINREQIFLGNYFIKRENDIYFYQAFYPIFYNLNDRSKSLKITFDMSSISDEEVNKLVKNNDINRVIAQNPSRAILSHYIIGAYDYMLFLYHYNTKIYFCIYNFTLNENRIIPLSTFENDISFDPGFPVVLTVDKEGYFYAYYEANSVVVDKNIKRDLQKSKYIIKLAELIKHNPNSSILIKFKLKNEIFQKK